MIAPQGLRNVGKLIAIVRDEGDERLPDLARQVLQVLATQIEHVEVAVATLEKQLMAWHKSNPVSQRLATIPGIGPIIATAIAAMVAEPSGFRSGREFAAWLGSVPRQNSTGGKTRLGGISKRGNQYLRRLLINGASANLLRSKATNADPWVIGLRRRRPSMVVAVALASKTARIAWGDPRREAAPPQLGDGERGAARGPRRGRRGPGRRRARARGARAPPATARPGGGRSRARTGARWRAGPRGRRGDRLSSAAAGTLSQQTLPRAATRAPGRAARSAPSSSRAASEASRVGRRRRSSPETSIRRTPPPVSRATATASAAASASPPPASPASVTRTQAHQPAGLRTHASDSDASLSAIPGTGEGGSSTTEIRPPSTSTSTRLLGPARQRVANRGRRRLAGGERERARLGGAVRERQRVAGGEELQRDEPREQERRHRREQLDRRLPATAETRCGSRPCDHPPASGSRLAAAETGMRGIPGTRPGALTLTLRSSSSSTSACSRSGSGNASSATRSGSPPTCAARAPARAAVALDQSAQPAAASWAAATTTMTRIGTIATSSADACPRLARSQLRSASPSHARR